MHSMKHNKIQIIK